MNEKFTQLRKLVQLNPDTMEYVKNDPEQRKHIDALRATLSDPGSKLMDEFLEKFAELIVKECAEYAEYQLQIGGIKADKIKKHFGI